MFPDDAAADGKDNDRISEDNWSNERKMPLESGSLLRKRAAAARAAARRAGGGVEGGGAVGGGLRVQVEQEEEWRGWIRAGAKQGLLHWMGEERVGEARRRRRRGRRGRGVASMDALLGGAGQAGHFSRTARSRRSWRLNVAACAAAAEEKRAEGGGIMTRHGGS